ncbi:MAG: hypothetical protein WC022_00490 [Parcubacteria group bacterium]
MKEAEIEEEGFWDYARMTIASLVAVAFLCILGVHFFFGIDALYQDGHFSYELGNHPGVTEISSICRRDFFPEIIQEESATSNALGPIMPKESDLTGEWFSGRLVWPAIWLEKSEKEK